MSPEMHAKEVQLIKFLSEFYIVSNPPSPQSCPFFNKQKQSKALSKLDYKIFWNQDSEKQMGEGLHI
jgi:hypothetical protein